MRLPKDVSGRLIAYSLVADAPLIASGSAEFHVSEYKTDYGAVLIGIVAILGNILLIVLIAFGVWHYSKVSNPLKRP